MKQTLAMAYSRGFLVGGGTVGATVNGLSAILAAWAGDVIGAVVTFWIAVALGWMARREWRVHRRGLAAFEP